MDEAGIDNNYLASLNQEKDDYFLTIADISTGEINTILLKTINDLHFYLFLCLNFLLLYGTY